MKSVDTKDTKDTKEIHYRLSSVSFVSALWRLLEQERRHFDARSKEAA
jgi:hypothetical protein